MKAINETPFFRVTKKARVFHARNGHPRVFGYDTSRRYGFSEGGAEERFKFIWENGMARAFSSRRGIGKQEVVQILPAEDASFVVGEYQYGVFEIWDVVYVAQFREFEDGAVEVTQLWEVGRRNRRLSMAERSAMRELSSCIGVPADGGGRSDLTRSYGSLPLGVSDGGRLNVMDPPSGESSSDPKSDTLSDMDYLRSLLNRNRN